MVNIKQLKQMMEEPASKEWFKKFGLPKSKYASASKQKALKNKTGGSSFEKQQDRIAKERKEYASKHKGTYKGRPIHELRKEAGL